MSFTSFHQYFMRIEIKHSINAVSFKFEQPYKRNLRNNGIMKVRLLASGVSRTADCANDSTL